MPKSSVFLISVLSIFLLGTTGCQKSITSNSNRSSVGAAAIPSTPKPAPTSYLESAPRAKIPEKVRKIAPRSTVLISDGDRVIGSGVIIDREENTLYVLTASHVVGGQPSPVEAPYFIKTYGGETFTIDDKTYDERVRKFRDSTDLAILVLTNDKPLNKKNQVATLNQSAESDMPSYIFGYRPCYLSTKGITDQKQQWSLGEIDQITNPNPDEEVQLGGYDIKYDNNTVRGMSGSPVFDAEGRLVAIHAKSDRKKSDYDSQRCDQIPSDPKAKYGQNWGISMKTALDSFPESLADLRSKLSIPPEISPPPPAEPSPTPAEGKGPLLAPSPLVNCGPLREPGEICPEESER